MKCRQLKECLVLSAVIILLISVYLFWSHHWTSPTDGIHEDSTNELQRSQDENNSTVSKNSVLLIVNEMNQNSSDEAYNWTKDATEMYTFSADDEHPTTASSYSIINGYISSDKLIQSQLQDKNSSVNSKDQLKDIPKGTMDTENVKQTVLKSRTHSGHYNVSMVTNEDHFTQMLSGLSKKAFDNDTVSRKSPKLENLSARPMNVLLLMADDMRPEIGAYLDPKNKPWLYPHIKTPNLDKLAKRSLVLHNAYVQMARCGPSRASVLTSRRPDTTHVTSNRHWFRDIGRGSNLITLPQFFRMHNYTTTGAGKIFHLIGNVPLNQDQRRSWSQTFYVPRGDYDKAIKNSWKAVTKDEMGNQKLRDQLVVMDAERRLGFLSRIYKSGGQPFFFAVGFKKPHLPYVFPEEFLDLYSEKDISQPINGFVPHNMPKLAWPNSHNLFSFADTKYLRKTWVVNSTLPHTLALQLRMAYYASVSYVDSLVGRLLHELDMQGVREKTIVVFLSDHGFQLGEHGIWGKNVNLELATNSPMILSVPGLTDKGIHAHQLTEFVDLFPTLAEVAELPVPKVCPVNSEVTGLCTEGTSWVPLIQNSDTTHWKQAVFSQYPHPDNVNPKFMGYTIRTPHYRYVEWVKYENITQLSWPHPVAIELYDLRRDLLENVNRASDSGYGKTIRTLSKKLHLGWRAATLGL